MVRAWLVSTLSLAALDPVQIILAPLRLGCTLYMEFSMRVLTLLASVLAVLLSCGPAAAQVGSARPQAQLPLGNAAMLRPVDEPLRIEMNRLREMVNAGLPASSADEAGCNALAAEIMKQLAVISRGRDFHSLDGRHLQWLLGDVSDGAIMMRDAQRLEVKQMGLMRVAESLNYYGREYDHPEWKSLQP